MSDTSVISVFAPAKINLTLHVRGRRPDGYHLLDSLVAFVGTGDWISVKTAADISLEIVGPFAKALQTTEAADNLVVRAARFLATTTDSATGAHITLEKNLPVASGIGGGSTDAAAALTACAQLWDTNLAQIADADLAARLGADVPVCLRRAATFMRGIGDDLTPAPSLPAAWLVLVNPGVPLATKAVFQALEGYSSAPPPDHVFTNLRDAKDLATALKTGNNDLARPAQTLMPDIPEMLRRLEDTPSCLLARMSGSGPTCFGLFADAKAASTAAAALQSARPDWWVAPAPFL